jgi:hypothetical protein
MALQPKLIRSRPPVTVNGRRMKRYDVTVTDEPFGDEVERAAMAVLPKLVPGIDDGTPPAGWNHRVTLHLRNWRVSHTPADTLTNN